MTNYQHVFEETLHNIVRAGTTPRLLLHVCCAPCSSSVLTCLTGYFNITLLYYNPNIYPESEYVKRGEQLAKLPALADPPGTVKVITADYRPEAFEAAAAGLEAEPEGGRRCSACFTLRLEEAAKRAADGGFDYFSTTLSVSPHKNAREINTIGGELAARYGVNYLYADFKKKDGYKKSVELSRLYDLYRQDYCGCVYSLAERPD